MDSSTSLKESRPLTHRETTLVVLGVLLPVFMGALDNTILASALPTIGRDFNDVHSLPWLITAYLIASTAMTPLYGKLSDIHGRRVTLFIAVGLYMAGSLICALAPNMLVLIFGRIVHGLGGGGLTAIGMVVLGDVAAPRDRGRYYGYFSITYTTAGACGPAFGGFIADYLHWSVIFWLNIPLGLCAIALALTLLRRLPRRERPHRLDFLGAALIMAAAVSFMLGLNLGGVRYAWTSSAVLSLFGVATVIGVVFVVRLLTAPEPLIPLSILSDPIARCIIACNAFGWASIVGLNIFLPIYLQSVLGYSAATAGLSLVVLMASLNISAGLSGRWLVHAQHYKILPMFGLALAMLAVLALAWQVENINLFWFEVLLVLIGIGFGAMPPLAAAALQNTVAIHQFGIAVGTMQFSRNLFSTILIAVLGALVLIGTSAEPSPGAAAAATSLYNATGFTRVFLMAAASLSASLICLALVEEKPLQTSHA
ncbi:MAG TPA: MFS transporter [Xanthobacteraceae bacterium]|nr:MFS transporter [Xanthobacteraceae bacterium]